MSEHKCAYNQSGMECPAHDELVEIYRLRALVESQAATIVSLRRQCHQEVVDGIVLGASLNQPSVEPEKSAGCPKDTCECDHSRGDHPIKDCDGCLGCDKFRLRDEPEKAGEKP